MLIGTDAAVAIPNVPTDPVAPGVMGGVVRVGEREALRDAELRLDQIEPGRIGRRVDRCDPKSAEESQEGGVIMHVGQIVEHDEEAPTGIALPQAAKGHLQFGDALPLGEEAREAIGVHIIEAEEVLHAMQATIRGAHPVRLAAARPGPTAKRPQL